MHATNMYINLLKQPSYFSNDIVSNNEHIYLENTNVTYIEDLHVLCVIFNLAIEVIIVRTAAWISNGFTKSYSNHYVEVYIYK